MPQNAWIRLNSAEHITLYITMYNYIIKVICIYNFTVPFYEWVSTASRLEPLRGGSLLCKTKFPEIPDTHFINLGRKKGWVDLGTSQWFRTRNHWIGDPALHNILENKCLNKLTSLRLPQVFEDALGSKCDRILNMVRLYM